METLLNSYYNLANEHYFTFVWITFAISFIILSIIYIQDAMDQKPEISLAIGFFIVAFVVGALSPILIPVAIAGIPIIILYVIANIVFRKKNIIKKTLINTTNKIGK